MLTAGGFPMAWSPQVPAAIKRAVHHVAPTQATNLALLGSALLRSRPCGLSQRARACPTPAPRRLAAPKHDLLHRRTRRWRFLNHARGDPLAVQCALLPHTLTRLGRLRRRGLTIDGTSVDAVLPTGPRLRSQVGRSAIPVRGRALPLVHLADHRDALPADQSPHQLEEAAWAAVRAARPPGVRPVVLAEAGCARATFVPFLPARGQL